MGEVAIDIEHLSKKFNHKKVIEQFDLSVQKGETIGIIGSNGSGKSTLLRLLSGIIKPSGGSIRIDGSVTSILEVGNGFHPDLTGRENSFLLARLRGFSDKEIVDGMDHIIAFSELEDAIDQPVKYYSNGMYLRLAFALFERFNSDILLLDEVLSVGDAAFKRKTANVMRKFKESGKTIVMVSHNMGEVINFCDRIVYMNQGEVTVSNNIREVVDNYLLEKRMNTTVSLYDSPLLYQDDTLKTKNGTWRSDLIELFPIQFSENADVSPTFYYSQEFTIQLKFKLLRHPEDVQLLIKMFDLIGNLVLTSSTAFNEDPPKKIASTGVYKMDLTVPARLLNKGVYTLALFVSEGDGLNVGFNDLAYFKIEHDNWLKKRPWATTPSFILTELPTSIEKIESI
jgi:ABC-type polysaccharide/polyol phosphate transport system ATPase subunit